MGQVSHGPIFAQSGDAMNNMTTIDKFMVGLVVVGALLLGLVLMIFVGGS